MLHFKISSILLTFQFFIFSTLLNYYCIEETEAGLGLPFGASVFPLLTTGWYYKPGPTEAVVLGLIVVKVLALKLAATLSGVPHHLNDIFDGFKFARSGRGKRAIKYSPNLHITESTLPEEDILILERVLLALRRIDSHDCFIRYICQVNQDLLKRNSTDSLVDDADTSWIELFRLRPRKESLKGQQRSIWDVYDEALKPYEMDCNEKYEQCPLTEQDLTKSSLLSGIF